MAANAFPPCPATLKPIMHYLKVAQEHDDRNPVVAYWSRLHALQVGLKISSGHKSKEETSLLAALMDWLETTKKAMSGNEAITNEVCAQATIEEYILKIFRYADEQDRAEVFNKNLVKAFYTCGIIMDVLSVFGELSEDILEKQKYSKWKAAYIHNCLKNGETPIPGPMREEGDEDNEDPPVPVDYRQNMPSPPPGPSGFQAPVFPAPPANFQPAPAVFQPGGFTPNPVSPTSNFPPPTGYSPYPPAPSTSAPKAPLVVDPSNFPPLTADQVSKAQKYCKWASSALNYDDTKTAVLNLQKALELLQTGTDPS